MLHTFIIASTNQPSLFEALGINWKLLVEQAIAFLILVFILGKFVYPALIKAIDARRDQIEAGLKEAKQSQEALEEAETKVADMIEQARKEADDIIGRSHQEAVAMVTEAEDKAKQRANQIVEDARAQLDIDVTRAREALKQDTIKLVATATERIIGEKLDDRKDSGLITKALEKERA
ncbi:MAG TPA: F0F1 ATP synthase subunit B [Candidatus Saccharimonadales bacterium]|jgi:F-type H+-transporting ATPase subunit b|nr:F0F1 ATP synthase subunit B [Candidatus Saccharimonadales bacterium]